jgi:hypothetical protein
MERWEVLMKPATQDGPYGSATSRTLAEVRADAATALAAFFRIAEAWHLTADEQRTLLGAPARTTFFRWRQGEVATVSVDLLERLSHLLAVYGALHAIYVEHDQADAWIRRPNAAPLFGGRPPLERMLGGRSADLYDVRRYIEGAATPAL